MTVSKSVFALYRSMGPGSEPGQSTTVSKVVFFIFFLRLSATVTTTPSFRESFFAVVLFFREVPFFSDERSFDLYRLQPYGHFSSYRILILDDTKTPGTSLFFPSLAETSSNKNLQLFRLPVVLGGRRREDSTLLVSGMNTNMESLSDEDDFA
jgi:hypothetical protein